MQLAFILYKYFPFGGLQRDFLRIAKECQARGHSIRVYTPIWEGDIPQGFDVRIVPVKALFNHHRNEKLTRWVKADLAADPVDRVVGFNKMPGLDVYYAADAVMKTKPRRCVTRCINSLVVISILPVTKRRCLSPRLRLKF